MIVDQMTTFFGWCTLFNILYLFVAFSAVTTFRDRVAGIHMKMFEGISKVELSAMYFKWLGYYKIVTVAFFLMPYLALQLFV